MVKVLIYAVKMILVSKNGNLTQRSKGVSYFFTVSASLPGYFLCYLTKETELQIETLIISLQSVPSRESVNKLKNNI